MVAGVYRQGCIYVTEGHLPTGVNTGVFSQAM